MDDRLKEIYYNPKHPAGFASVTKLVKESGYSREKVKKWLEKQSTYTLHRSARKKYPTRKYIVHDVDEQWQADLADVTLIAKYNKGYKFLLTVIDLFSRYAWVRPLKTKSGKEVAAAFNDIFQEGRIPKRIQTDQGKEFENRNIATLFGEHNIELFSVKSAYKAAVVERFNRTLKSKLWRYFTMTLKEKWTDVLQDIVESYNNSIHRSIGRKPVDVTRENASELREEDRMKTKKAKSTQAVKEKNDLKVGDSVRISKVKSIFAKGYLPNWTEEIFTVASINTKFSPITYKLRDYSNEIIEGSFYRHEIQKIMPSDDDTFLLERIVRTEKRGNEKWSLVKWKGYPSSMNSWVRQRDIIKVTNRESV
jgi:transcription antitermination factor NusG